jgi:hypothetical protein
MITKKLMRDIKSFPINDNQIRKQTLEEVLKDLKRTKKIIETYIKPLSEYERGRYEHAWNMILELEQKLRETK